MKDYLNNLKKILNILPNHLIKRFKLIFFLLSIGGLLETLGIGAIIPLISIIINEESGTNIIRNFVNFDLYSKNQILIFLGLLIFILYLIKAVFLSILEFSL